MQNVHSPKGRKAPRASLPKQPVTIPQRQALMLYRRALTLFVDGCADRAAMLACIARSLKPRTFATEKGRVTVAEITLVLRSQDECEALWAEIRQDLTSYLWEDLSVIDVLREIKVASRAVTTAPLVHEWAQLSAFFKKSEVAYGLRAPTQHDRRNRASDVWVDAEEQCAASSHWIQYGVRSPLFPDRSSFTEVGGNVWMDVMELRDIIRGLIGAKPPADVLEKGYFTSGASVGIASDKTSLPRKWGDWRRITTTTGALWHGVTALRSTRIVKEQSGVTELAAPLSIKDAFGTVTITLGNKLAFVPKTVETDRSIAVEPLLNGFVQSAIDTALRERLPKWGLDLTDQKPNQHLAWKGSVDGSYATLDLSSASDTISETLVRAIFPPAWVELFDAARSEAILVPEAVFNRLHAKGLVRLETFSKVPPQGYFWYRPYKYVSMGNNFCFPLQTIIFAAVCKLHGARKGSFRVYGDDIVVRSEIAEAVKATLTRLGFLVNADKSFLTGPFRESCGADWYSGAPVRPAFVRGCWSQVCNFVTFLNVYLEKGPGSVMERRAYVENVLSSPEAPFVFRRPCADGKVPGNSEATLDGGAVNTDYRKCRELDPNVKFKKTTQWYTWKESREEALLDHSAVEIHCFEFLFNLERLASIGSESSRKGETPPLRFRTRTVTIVRK